MSLLPDPGGHAVRVRQVPASPASGPGVLITYTATSPPDPVTGKTLTTAVERDEFWNDGREAA